MTYDDIVKANEALKSIPVKGNNYVQVNERVKAFRMICPNGSITTEIVALDEGVVTMRTTIMDEGGLILATGYAQEKESSSYINKTSFIENCETSSVGRALGFLGIGIDGSMASAEEVANAIINQGKKPAEKEPEKKDEYITKAEQKTLINMIQKRGLNVDNVLGGVPIEKVTAIAYADAVRRLSKLPEVAG